MAEEKKHKLWVPRTSMYLSHGLTRDEPLFEEMDLPGMRGGFSISLVAELSRGSYAGLYWIMPPKKTKDLKKAKDLLLTGIDKAVSHGLVRNLTSQPNDGLLFDPPLMVLKKSKGRSKPKSLPKRFELPYLTDQIIPLMRSLYAVDPTDPRNGNMNDLEGKAFEMLSHLTPCLMGVRQRNYAAEIAYNALRSNPEPINSWLVYRVCKEFSSDADPLDFNGRKPLRRYPSLKDLTAKVNENESKSGKAQRHKEEVHIALEYLKGRGMIYEVHDRSSQPAYRANHRLVSKRYGGKGKRLSDSGLANTSPSTA